MWVKCNPNPLGKMTGDCVIRAIAIATNQSWRETYRDLCRLGERMGDLPNANAVWGAYLREKGAEQFLLPESCPECITVEAFAQRYPGGVYVIGTGDIEMIDKLTHSAKSLITACAMLEAEDGYSGDYSPMGPYYGGTRRYSYTRTGNSGNYGGYARNEGRYGRENRSGGYSRGMDWNEHLRMMMDEAPDEATRMDIKKLMDRMAN